MYKEDVKEINNFVSINGLPAFKSVFYFVLGSIRSKFYLIENITKDIIEKGESSKHIWGNKVLAYNQFNAISDKLFEDIISDRKDTASLTLELMNIHGIGLAKASFFLQLLGRETACLDVHNLNKLGLSSSYFKNATKINEYLELVNKDGTEYWWDSWCDHISVTYPKIFNNAEEVSKLHVKAITQ